LIALAALAPWTPVRNEIAALGGRPAAERDRLGSSGWNGTSANAGPLPYRMRRLALKDSAVGGDGFTGEHTTGWYAAAPDAAILVAGYPTLPPNRLELEVLAGDGSSSVLVFQGVDPGEGWAAWRPGLPATAKAFRIHAVDGTTGFHGWLGFSEPFRLPLGLSWDPWMVWQTLTTVALAVVLVFAPGLLWRARYGSLAMAVLVPGPVLLAVGGGACWALGGAVAPIALATAWVYLSLALIAWLAWRLQPWTQWGSAEARVYLIVPLLVLGAAAKAALSGGPADELFRGTVSRSLEVGGHSDSRISYHTAQVVANHLSPQDPRADRLFAPWHFSSRGPTAGLASVPILLATHGHPPIGEPNEAWEPFDHEGFAAYRITMMALDALGLWAVWALLLKVSGEKAAWLGASLVALSPFLWHEAYFSWPKMAAAAWVLGSFHALLAEEGFFAGLWLGGAYLFHPLALLSAPFLGLWALLAGPDRPWRRRVGRGLGFCLGLGLVVLVWNLFNGFQKSNQAGFLAYAKGADEVYDVTLGVWLKSRWTDTLNTLVPGYVFLVNARHPSYNPLGKVSDGWVHFWTQYWTAAPFAAGILTFFAALPAFLRGLWRNPRVAAAVFLGPLVFLILFWGVATTGLMRESGHVLFLSGWVFLVWAGADRIPPWVMGRLFTSLRVIEVLAMMFGTAFVAGNWGGTWLINDLVWLVVAVLSVAGVGWIVAGGDAAGGTR
jgi:hypothetical protein